MAGFPIWRTLARDDVLRELVYTAREFYAAEALAHGLVSRLAEDPRAAARALPRPHAGRTPHAIRGAKRFLPPAHRHNPSALPAAATRSGLDARRVWKGEDKTRK